ncbi:MAG: hypothetical protein INR70_29640 [Parafilimonas terrae]|jgi:hypothetical protein|nr:hypothetical protein [Parafilimonas terrae]
MPAQYCSNPLDPGTEEAVLVIDEDDRPLAAIRSVIDAAGHDLLPTLSDACIRILQLEIAVYHGRIEPYAWTQHAVDVVAPPAAA